MYNTYIYIYIYIYKHFKDVRARADAHNAVRRYHGGDLNGTKLQARRLQLV